MQDDVNEPPAPELPPSGGDRPHLNPQNQPKRKGGWPKGRKRTKPAPKQPKPPLDQARSPYEGVTPMSCCDDCKPGRCVITWDSICGRPSLGLQPRHALRSDVVQRRNAAKQYMMTKIAEKKYA